LSEHLLETPLAALHRRLGARLVPFAGHAMPVQYPAGIMAEHAACREGAALFDVSHMGQGALAGADAAARLERLVPGDITGLAPGRQRYTLLLDEAGGILDDLMVANMGDRLALVVNAANRQADFAHLRASFGDALHEFPDRALLALQGPRAAAIMAPLCPAAAALPFMGAAEAPVAGTPALITRSGYTGEDGFEISLAAAEAEALAQTLLDAGATPAGLGARDSLRLEAGLCLHGNDITAATNPVEAALLWTIPKRRREACDFIGGQAVKAALAAGPQRLRVGFLVADKVPVRAGTEIRATDGTSIGSVTSGVPSPTLGVPVAMGYVTRAYAAEGTPVEFSVRGRLVPGRVAKMPFVPHRYVR
jgi:aminomethyltransferase